MHFIRRILGKFSKALSKREPGTRPPDWNLTIADLMDEMASGKRKSVGQPELDWARDYERGLIPDGIRFPRKGDVYESLVDQTVDYLTAWAAPFTGSGEAILRKGERVWIDTEPVDEKPIGTYAIPINYNELEERMVPGEEKNSPKYGGFYFFFKTVDLNERFRLVETDHVDGGKKVCSNDDG